MKDKYIIVDDKSRQVWYGAYSPVRFSRPGFTNAEPMYFDTIQEAMAEGNRVEQHFPGTLMIPAPYFVFRPEEAPPEKTARPRPLSDEPPPEAYLLQKQLTLVEQQSVMIKLTHHSLMMMAYYLN